MRLSRSVIAALGGLLVMTGQLSCGGGAPIKANGKANSTIAGTVVKGPVAMGTVTAYKLDAQLHRGVELATATTDGSGTFTLSLPAYTGAILVVASTGTYTEESLGLGVQLDGHELTAVVSTFQAGVPVTGLWLTPISTLAASLATYHVQSKGEALADAIGDAYSHLNAHFGGVDWRSTTPVDVTVPGATNLSPGVTEGLMLASLSFESRIMAERAGVTPGLTVNGAILTEALAKDLSDGTFDGVGSAGPLTLPPNTPVSVDGGASGTALGGNGVRLLLAQAMQQFIGSDRNASSLRAADVQSLAATLAADSDPYLFCPGQVAGPSCTTTMTTVNPPVITWDTPAADAGVHAVTPVQLEAQSSTALATFTFSSSVPMFDGGAPLYDDHGCGTGQHNCHAVISGEVNVSSVPDGPLLFTAAATDTFGNPASSSLQVLVDNHGPVIQVQTPSVNADLKGTIQVIATATAQQGSIASLVVLSPPTGLGANQLPAAGSYAATWDTTQTLDGPVALRFLATDSLGASTELDVPVTVDNLPFAQITVGVFAGAPIAGANVQIVAINDVDGGLLNVGDGGPVLGVSSSATSATGQTTVTLSVKNYAGDIQIQAAGLGLQYVDPSDGVTSIAIPSSFTLTSTMAGYNTTTQPSLTAAVSLWTTLADAAALAYAQGHNPTHAQLGSLSAALAVADPAFERHVAPQYWPLRSSLPANLTQPPPQSLQATVYAALPDLALNQLARDWSVGAGLTPGQVITAPAVVATLANEDLAPDDLFNGLGFGGVPLSAPGNPPVSYDANSTRASLALSLDRWLRSAQNHSGLARTDLLGAGVYDAICLDESLFYPPSAVQPPIPWSSVNANPPVLTWLNPIPGGGAHGVVDVQLQATDASTITTLAFAGALRPATSTITPQAVDAGVAELLSGSLDVSSLPDGPATLSATATDSWGNTAASTLNFTIANNAPVITVTSPAAGSTVNGTVAVSASATTGTGVITSVVLVGPPLGMGTNTTSVAADFQTSWDTTQDLEGPVTLHFQATTSVGESADLYVPVTIHNVPFGHFMVYVTAGAPIPGATVSVYALEADGGYAQRGDAGPLLGQGGPTAAVGVQGVDAGEADFYLTGENFSGPVQVVVTGASLSYVDPSADPDAGNTSVQFSNVALTTTLANYTTGQEVTVPVTLWTTLADVEARAYAQGLNPATNGATTSLPAAMAVTDPLFASHLAGTPQSPAWNIRTTLPVSLTQSGPQTLRAEVYAAMPDVALNELARSISATIGTPITAIDLLAKFAPDLETHGQFTGIGASLSGPTGNYTLTANTTREQLAIALNSFIIAPWNATGITQSSLITPSGVYQTMSDDTSLLYAADQPIQPFDDTPPTVVLSASFTIPNGADAGAIPWADAGFLVCGVTKVTADASAQVAVASVSLGVGSDAGLIPLGYVPPGNTPASHVAGSWNTAAEPDGPFTVFATSIDVLSNTSTTPFSLISDNTPPTMAQTGPAGGWWNFTGNQPIPIVVTATDIHGAAIAIVDAGYGVVPVAINPPGQMTVDWLEPTIGDGAHSFPFTATDPVGNKQSFLASVRTDQTPPVITFYTAPPAFTNQSAYSFELTAIDPSAGVKTVTVAQTNATINTTYLATRTGGFISPNAWGANVTLGTGSNTFKIYGVDNALPAGNSGIAAPLTRTIVLDQSAPGITPVPVASYYPEGGSSGGVQLAATTSGSQPSMPVMPPTYLHAGVTEAAVQTTLTTGKVYKAITHLAWVSQPTPSQLETGTADNIPYVQYQVAYAPGTDSPIASATYSVSCLAGGSGVSGCASSTPVTGNLWSSPKTSSSNVYYDLPISSNLFPELNTVTDAAILAVTVTVTDTAGNISTNVFNVTFTVCGPPIVWSEDTNYPNESDPSSVFPYQLSTPPGISAYSSEWETGNAAFHDASVRMVRYIAYNASPLPVVVQVAMTGATWTPQERWDDVVVAFPQTTNPPAVPPQQSFGNAGFTYKAPAIWKSGPDACPQLMEGSPGSRSYETDPGCAAEPTFPCPTGYRPYHGYGSSTQWSCTEGADPVNGTAGPWIAPTTVNEAQLVAYDNPQTNGNEATDANTATLEGVSSSSGDAFFIIPGATGTTPGAITVYIAHPVVSTPLASEWENLSPAPVSLPAYEQPGWDFWDFSYEITWSDQAGTGWVCFTNCEGGDVWQASRYFIELTHAQEGISATLSGQTYGLANGAAVGTGHLMFYNTPVSRTFTH